LLRPKIQLFLLSTTINAINQRGYKWSNKFKLAPLRKIKTNIVNLGYFQIRSTLNLSLIYQASEKGLLHQLLTGVWE